MKRFMVATAILSALLVAGVPCFLLAKSGLGASAEPNAQGAGYSAYSVVYIARQPPFVLHQVATDKEEFEHYRRYQIALIKSRLVLNAALHNPKVAALPVLKQHSDPVAWLEKTLVVDSPENDTLLRIGLKGDDPAALVLLVDAIRDAYVKDTLYKAHTLGSGRLNRLKDLYADYDDKLRNKRKHLSQLAWGLGVGGKEPQQARIEVARDLMKELPRLRLAQTAAQVRLQKAEGKQAEDLKLELAVLDAQVKMINDGAEVFKDRLGVDWLEDEIKHLEITFRRIAAAIEEAEIELQAPARIGLMQEAVATKNE